MRLTRILVATLAARHRLFRRHRGQVRHQQDPRDAQAHAPTRHPAPGRDGHGGGAAPRARGVTDRQLDAVRQRVEDSISADPSRKLVACGRGQRGAGRPGRAGGAHQRERHLRDEAGEDGRAAGVGREEEEDVTKDIYSDRQEPVTIHKAQGRLAAHVEVDTPLGPRTADASGPYQDEFKGDARIPAEAVVGAGARALPRGPGRRTRRRRRQLHRRAGGGSARRGRPSQGRQPPGPGRPLEGSAGRLGGPEAGEGREEAARFHNIGVAHEALAYTLPTDSPEHLARPRAGAARPIARP